MNSLFSNQVVLITGASMGIGRELALAFAKYGAKLVLAARSLPELESVAQEAFKAGSDILVIKADLTQEAERIHLISEIEKKYGKLDLLINNAGKGLYSLVENAQAKSVADLFDLNLFALMDLTQKALPLLREDTASPFKTIVNISSLASFVPVPKMSFYCASKAALNGFANTLRIELAHEKIRVLNVYPGLINTSFSQNAPNPAQATIPKAYKTVGQGYPPRKLAQKILRAILRKKSHEYVTFSNWLIIKSYQHLPSLVNLVMKRFV